MADARELTRRWVQVLSGEIGARLAGTEEDARAADFMEAEFGRVFPEVHRHEFRFLGWRPGSEGRLEIDGETVPTRLGISCPSTPATGVRGRLRRFGASDRYGLWEEGAGGPSAHLMAYAGPGGQAIPLLWDPYGSMPAGILGADAAERLSRVEREGHEVSFSCRTEFVPNAASWNLEGILPGDPERWIIVVGHHDTVYGSPGANDNTASVACLPAIALGLAEQTGPRRPTLCFLATGGEEVGLQGSLSYVRDLGWSGGNSRVVLVINFDSLTWGDDLSVSYSPNAEPFVGVLTEAFGTTPTSAYTGRIEPAPLARGGALDSIAFANAGIPTLNVNTEGDTATSALWHTPEDTPDRVPWGRVDDAVPLFVEFIDRVCAGTPAV